MHRDIPVQSVKKALDLLNLLVFEDPERAGLALGDLAERLQFPVATTHNLLKTLCACDYASRAGVGRYTVGPRCNAIGRFNHLLSESTATAIRSRMAVLGSQLNETVTFVVLAGGRRLPLWTTESDRLIQVDATALANQRIFAMPTGRILAAFATAAELKRLIVRYGLPTSGDWPLVTTREAFDKALAEIRRCGHERVIRDEITAFAVPVWDATAELIGSLGCFSPSFRCPPKQHATVVAALKQTAQEITVAF